MDHGLELITAFAQVVFIDLILAGDNAVVVGMAAAGVAREQRSKVIMMGIAAAVVLRILFALVTTQLMAVVGLTLAGGFLLLWVCWKLFREIRAQQAEADGEQEVLPAGSKTVAAAVWQVVIADVSMSLDNVLAVAGAARDHPEVLIAGLALSVVLMGAAAAAIARMLNRWPWIAYIGLVVIVYVAMTMIWAGGAEVAAHAGIM